FLRASLPPPELLEPSLSLQFAQQRCPPATRHQDSALPTVRRSLRFASRQECLYVRASSHVTSRCSSMNQGIRTLIYPVKDAQRSSTFFRQLLGVDPSHSLTTSPSGSETGKLL